MKTPEQTISEIDQFLRNILKDSNELNGINVTLQWNDLPDVRPFSLFSVKHGTPGVADQVLMAQQLLRTLGARMRYLQRLLEDIDKACGDKAAELQRLLSDLGNS